jgi:hypothetical protein
MDLNTPLPANIVSKRAFRPRIEWTEEMLNRLTQLFSTTFNKDIAAELGVSWRSVVRKARELGLNKADGFLDDNRTEIVKRIMKVRRHNPKQKGKGYVIPNSEQYRYVKGHTPANKNNPELTAKIQAKRNETIRRDRIRRQYGMPPLTSMKLKV